MYLLSEQFFFSD